MIVTVTPFVSITMSASTPLTQLYSLTRFFLYVYTYLNMVAYTVLEYQNLDYMGPMDN